MNALDWCTRQALQRVRPHTRQAFAGDPLGVAQTHLGFKIRAVETLTEQRRDGGACDGVSYIRDGVILYAATRNSRRENFTIAHEVGHMLVDQQEQILDWLADQDQPAQLLETICDRIAQRLVLDSALVETVIGAGPVRAAHIEELFRRSQASRPACAIAIAGKLPHLGAVTLIDRDLGIVRYASIRPDPLAGWPTVFPWPGQSVPDGHPLLDMASDGRLTRKISWRTPWGRQQEFYADATSDDRIVTAVFSDVDLWATERLHTIAPREFDRRPVLEVACCGATRRVRGYPCETCHQPFCPSCGRCRCDRIAKTEQQCTACSMRFQPHLLLDGLCELCHP